MRLQILSTAFNVCFFCVIHCNSQHVTITKRIMVPLEVKEPEIISNRLPNKMFIGIDENNNWFYYLGDKQKCTAINFTDLDFLVKEHKKRFSNAGFVIKECDTVNINSLKKLVDKLVVLGIKRLTLDNSKPCHP